MAERLGRAKVGLYFDLLSDVDADKLLGVLKEEAERNAGRLSDDVEQRVARRVTDMPTIPHQRLMASSPKPFDYSYQLAAEDTGKIDSMIDAAATLGKVIAPAIDKAHAAVLVGREIAITRGDGPIFNIMPLRRLPELTHENFMEQWFDRHATLGEGVEGVRYRQNHVSYDETEALADKLGLDFPPMDGLTESYFDTVDAAVEILSQDSVVVDAIDDEKRFIDHKRSQFGLYRTVWHNR